MWFLPVCVLSFRPKVYPVDERCETCEKLYQHVSENTEVRSSLESLITGIFRVCGQYWSNRKQLKCYQMANETLVYMIVAKSQGKPVNVVCGEVGGCHGVESENNWWSSLYNGAIGQYGRKMKELILNGLKASPPIVERGKKAVEKTLDRANKEAAAIINEAKTKSNEFADFALSGLRKLRKKIDDLLFLENDEL